MSPAAIVKEKVFKNTGRILYEKNLGCTLYAPSSVVNLFIRRPQEQGALRDTKACVCMISTCWLVERWNAVFEPNWKSVELWDYPRSIKLIEKIVLEFTVFFKICLFVYLFLIWLFKTVLTM